MGYQEILTSLQLKFLRSFFNDYLEGQQFFLTGGTALAAFYLEHRTSEDLDLFTLDRDALIAADRVTREIFEGLQLHLLDAKTFTDFHQFVVTASEPEGALLRVDLVRDINVQFGEKRVVDGMQVDSLENIGSNKICSLLGRTEAKDFVDLYFILKEGLDFWSLFDEAKQKDLGLTEFYFAGALLEVRNLTTLPRMIKPVALEELQDFFVKLANQILDSLNPKRGC